MAVASSGATAQRLLYCKPFKVCAMLSSFFISAKRAKIHRRTSSIVRAEIPRPAQQRVLASCVAQHHARSEARRHLSPINIF